MIPSGMNVQKKRGLSGGIRLGTSTVLRLSEMCATETLHRFHNLPIASTNLKLLT